MNMIWELCNGHTSLTDHEITKIQQVAATLQLLANIEKADIFVDCMANNGEAIVVAEARPVDSSSVYKKSVVGMFARKENEPAVARTFRLGVVSRQIKAVTQESVQVIQSVAPIYYEHHVIGVLIIEKPVDAHQYLDQYPYISQKDNKRTENLLPNIIGENNLLSEYIDEALIMVDHKGMVTYCNTLAQNLYSKLGFVDNILGKTYESIRLTDHFLSGEKSLSIEVDVGKYFLSIKYVLLEVQTISFAMIIRDITDMKEQEKELVLKSVVIQEMHHRIKNNLQTIASLLRLQMRRTDSQETRQVLGESMNRILSIAATHELLAQSGVDNVKIGGLIVYIKNNTVRYFAGNNLDASIVLEGDDFEVESDLATAIALIINELLQNSLEYAFVDRNKGLIRILVKKGELYSQIQVIDDGIGFDIEKESKGSLGLSIVKSLVRDKLKGQLDINSGTTGTKVTFSFLSNLINRSDVM